MSEDEVKELLDLVGFLHDKKPEVQRAALDIVVGLTGSPDGIARLKAVQAQLLSALLRLVPAAPAAEVSRGALAALVNLSQDGAVAGALLGANAVGRVMEWVRDKSCPHIELLLMLLVNLTVADQGCEDLLQLAKPGMEGLNMALLLKLFVTSAVTLLPGQPDPYEHIGALLTNTTRLGAGRQVLLQPGRGFLHALAAQLHAGCSLARRRGCSGALRNCCISAEADGTLVELVADEAVLARLLAPLGGGSTSGGGGAAPAAASGAPAAASGPAPAAAGRPAAHAAGGPGAKPTAAAVSSGGGGGREGGQRDPDDTVREALAEAVAVLAATDLGRKALWKVSAPDLLRKAYEDEEHPGVCQAMEAAARCFLFDRDARDAEGGGEEAAHGEAALQEAAAVAVD